MAGSMLLLGVGGASGGAAPPANITGTGAPAVTEITVSGTGASQAVFSLSFADTGFQYVRVADSMSLDINGANHPISLCAWVKVRSWTATDATYKRWVLDPPDGTLVRKINWRDNPWFPEILRRQKDELRRKDPDAYETVWEGNTRKALEGAIYAKEIALAIGEGRISPQIKHDKFRPVDVSFDLGRADRTSIWFWQQNGMDHYAVDHYSNCGFGMDHYLAQMQDRKYLYRRIYLPHDAAHHHQSAQKSIEMQVREVYPGEGRVKIVPKIGIAAGINVTRAMWPRIHMNEGKCADGITSLQHYRYAVDPDTGQRSPNPLHDWASHDADGLRCYTVGLREDAKPQAEAASRPPKMFRTGQGWMK